jgi:hypothetical protein
VTCNTENGNIIFTSCCGTNMIIVLIGVDAFSLTGINGPHIKGLWFTSPTAGTLFWRIR